MTKPLVITPPAKQKTSFLRSPVAFLAMTVCAVQFVVLTIIAMFLHPGGNQAHPDATRYEFFYNFFSDLGLITTFQGRSNYASAVLFFIALTLAGAGLVWFFILAPRLFKGYRFGRILAILGSIAGIVSGLAYIGVAFTPADLFLDAHIRFVFWAFQAYPVAVIFYIFAILLHKEYPNRFALAYGVFACVLIVYLWLLFNGPSGDTERGLLIQVTGQKIVAYASIITMFIQGIGAWQLEKRDQMASKLI